MNVKLINYVTVCELQIRTGINYKINISKTNLEKKIGFVKRLTTVVKYYPWFPLLSTGHNILFYDHNIIENCIVPLGLRLLSEKAQEFTNKAIKNYRQTLFSKI